jgi:NAD(P)-dependent dehydrogenase (short-subunit alcohol dehydrogenase family)
MDAMLKGKTVLIAGGTGALPAALASGLTAAGAAVRALECGDSGLDILLNIIGPARPAGFFDMSRADWDSLLSVALGDAFERSQALAREISLAGGQGTMINVACDPESPEAFAPTSSNWPGGVRTVLFLCAAHGTFVTGETIDVSGSTAGLRVDDFPA